MRRQIIGNLGRIWQTSFVVMAGENTGDASIFPFPWKKNHPINFSTKVSIHPMLGPSTSTRPSLGRCPGPPFTGEDTVLFSENWDTRQPEPEFRALQPPKPMKASSALIPWNRFDVLDCQGHMYVRRVPHGAHLGIFHDLVEPLDQVVQTKLGQVLGDARPGNAAPQALPLLMKAQSIELSRLCTVTLSPQIFKGRWERNTSNQQLLQNTSCSLILKTSCIGNTPFVGKFKYHHGWYLINLRKYLSNYFCHCWWLITSNRFCCVDHLWLVLVSFPSFADRPFWHFLWVMFRLVTHNIL